MDDNLEKQTILVVDDTPENIDVLSHVLRSDYRVKAALNGERAIKIANSQPKPDMILLDIIMPGMDGYTVCRELKRKQSTADIPVIFVTAMNHEEDETKGLELGAVDYITKPISPAIVMARVQTHLALYDQNRELERKVQERTVELQDTRLEIIRRLGRAAEFKDNETGLHVIRMSHYVRLIAEAMELDAQKVDVLFHAAPMHDIGKIGIPDNMLLKSGKLTDEEWNIMKKHPEIGANIIGEHPSELLQISREMALTHHEKWDGTGYPYGLKGYEIPLSGRIAAISDVFDALTSIRPYKKPWNVEDAIKYIDDNAGVHFDPDLVPLIHEAMPEILDIKEVYSDATYKNNNEDSLILSTFKS